jgi:hypothetical protein
MPGFQSPVPLLLNGHVHPTIIHEIGGTAPSNILKAGAPFTVHIDWGIEGSAVPLIAGDFHLRVYFEGFGTTAPEPEFGPVVRGVLTAPLGPGPGPAAGLSPVRHYTDHIPIPTGLTVAGAYKMVVLITYLTPGGAPGPIAGYSDEVFVQVFP